MTVHPAWLIPAVALLWLAFCALLSRLGGWQELAARFASSARIDGEQFRFRSVGLGTLEFPITYRTCVSATIGPAAFRLSLLAAFRFRHPPLVIPWSEVERCEDTTFGYVRYIVVHLKGFKRYLMFKGVLGQAMLDTWNRVPKR